MTVIDFHSHILPAIDDGSKNLKMSVEMVEAAISQDVDVMVATPHFYAYSAKIKDFLKKRQEAYDQLIETIGNKPIKIILGAEVAYFKGISYSDQLDRMTIGDTNVLLLELPFQKWEKEVVEEVRNMVYNSGYKIMLAHLDRYMSIEENKNAIKEILSMPIVIQFNVTSFDDFFRRRKLGKIIKNGYDVVLGSDCHNLKSRRPNLQHGRDVVEKKIGQQYLDRIDECGTALLHE